MYPLRKKGECKIADQGFLNYNLCLNAQTSKKHTEYDASYTIISDPVQLSKKITFVEKTKDNLS